MEALLGPVSVFVLDYAIVKSLPNVKKRTRWLTLGLFVAAWIVAGAVMSWVTHQLAAIAETSARIAPAARFTPQQKTALHDAIEEIDRSAWQDAFFLGPFAKNRVLYKSGVLFLAMQAPQWTQTDYQAWMDRARSTDRADIGYLTQWIQLARQSTVPAHAPETDSSMAAAPSNFTEGPRNL